MKEQKLSHNKILAICATFNFQHFTRRTTFEAIATQYHNLEALCATHINHRKKINTSSDSLQVRPFYYFVPERLRKTFLGRAEKNILLKKWNNYFKNFKVIFLTSPNQYYFIDFFPYQKIIFLISDPYHLSNPEKSDETLERTKQLYNRADLVLTTNKNIKNVYLPKYLGANDLHKVHYWPNTVDMKTWDYKKYPNSHKENNKTPLIGMAGNINWRTDLRLLDFITTKRPNYNFVLCGINYLKNPSDVETFSSIVAKANVEYLGYIDFNILPQTVSTWDVGITIEGKREYAKYVHHNKIYQYMALGLPVVTYKINDEYHKLKDIISIPDTYEEFVENIDKSLEKRKNESFIQELIQSAADNSSIIRAEQFNTILEQNLANYGLG